MANPVPFFLERYAEAYKNELIEFAECIKGEKQVSMDEKSVKNVTLICDAAKSSAWNGLPVEIDYDQRRVLLSSEKGNVKL